MDLFSLEVVDNEILCVCNLCNTGLDNESELANHMQEEHGKSFNWIRSLTSGRTARAGIVALAWSAL